MKKESRFEKLNYEIPLPDLKRISVLIVYIILLFAATLVVWYYFVAIIPAKEAEAKNKRLEAVVEIYKLKYCKLPYESDAAKRLCTQNPSQLDVR